MLGDLFFSRATGSRRRCRDLFTLICTFQTFLSLMKLRFHYDFMLQGEGGFAFAWEMSISEMLDSQRL